MADFLWQVYKRLTPITESPHLIAGRCYLLNESTQMGPHTVKFKQVQQKLSHCSDTNTNNYTSQQNSSFIYTVWVHHKVKNVISSSKQMALPLAFFMNYHLYSQQCPLGLLLTFDPHLEKYSRRIQKRHLGFELGLSHTPLQIFIHVSKYSLGLLAAI